MKTILSKAGMLLALLTFFVWHCTNHPVPPDEQGISICAKIDTIYKYHDYEPAKIQAGIDALQGYVSSFENKPDRIHELACAFHGLGALYYAQDNLDSAILFTQHAVEKRNILLQRGFATRDDSTKTAGSYHNLGKYQRESWNGDTAITNLSQAISLYRQLRDTLLSESQREKGNALDLIGDYFEANKYFTAAIQTAREINDAYLIGKGYIDMSASLNLQGEYRAALDTLGKAAQYLDAVDNRDIFVYYQNIGNALDYLGRYQSAIDTFEKALSYCDTAEDSCTILNYIGVSKRKNGEPEAAEAVLDKALNMAKQHQLREMEAAAYDNLAEIYLLKKQFGAALASLAKARDIVWNRGSLKNVANKPFLFTFLFDEGKVRCQMQGQEDNALEAFSRADSLLDYIRWEQQAEGSKLVWRRKVTSLYELALGACLRKNYLDKAFYYMEKSKSVLLHDALAGLSARRILGDSLGKVEFDLQVALKKARTNFQTGSDQNKWLDSIREYQDKLEKHIAFVTEKFPEYARAKYNSKLISLAEVQSNLSDSSCFIQFFYGEQNLFAFLASKNKASQLIKIEKDTLFDKELQRFYSFCSTAPEDARYSKQEFLDLGFRIFDTLFTPLQILDYKKAVIVPDGLLAQIPFDALPTQPHTWNPVRRFKNSRFLLHSLQTQLAWSGTILWQFQADTATEKLKKGQLAFFAPERFPNTDRGTLSGSEALYDSIQHTLGKGIAVPFFQSKASSKNFKANSLDFLVYHFHTHAVARPEKPPYLHFYQDSLFMEDFYTTYCKADLFILGACETNRGTFHPGEGAFSLSRALTYAGVPSVISSLWTVKARPTEELFGYFYDNLKKGYTKSDALYQAKRRWLAENAHLDRGVPVNWAAWAFAGEDNSLSFEAKPSEFSILRWLVGGLVILVLSLLFWRFRKK